MFTGLLTSKANVYRQQDATASGMGPATDTGAFTLAVALAVPCRVAQQSQRIRTKSRTNDKDAIIDIPTIFTDPNPALRVRDRFILLNPDGTESTTDIYDTVDLNPVQGASAVHHYEFVSHKVS